MPADPNKQTTEDPLQWVAIDDFSPGCYSNGGVVVGNSVDRMLSAPPGAADAENTWSCYALPDKSLAALPGVTDTYVWPANYNSNPATTPPQTSYLTGCIIHDELGDSDTEAILICVFDDLGSTYGRSFQAVSFQLETLTTNNIILVTGSTSSGGIFGSPYPQFTRAFISAFVGGVTITNGTDTVTVASGGFPGFVAGEVVNVMSTSVGTAYFPSGTTVVSIVSNTMTLSNNAIVTGGPATGIIGTPGLAGTSSSSTSDPGQPVVVFPSGPPEQPAGTSQVYMYPNPTTPSSFAPLTLITGAANAQSSVAGQLFVHQSRILIYSSTNYTWPIGGTFFTNENLNFTDPPNSAVLGDQQTVLAAEEPFGYGTGGSISAGEFFIIKKRGGGLVVTGDIFSPNVTILPGVQSTGNIVGQGASTPAGFVYCSFDNGAWVWSGGSTSSKISQNLDDGFFLPPEYSSGMKSNNYGFYVNSFGDKVYFSNNWLWDTRTGGWWPYYPRKAQGGADLFWVQPVNGNYIYAAQLSFTHPNLDFMYRFDPATSAQTYQWQSLPFRTTDRDHRADIREIVIRASCSTNQTNPFTVTILDQNATVATLTTTDTVVGPGPQLIRFNAPGGGLSEPAIRVTSTNSTTGDSPIIHSIEVGYRLRAHQAAGN
jgi:hypothetical protein